MPAGGDFLTYSIQNIKGHLGQNVSGMSLQHLQNSNVSVLPIPASSLMKNLNDLPSIPVTEVME